MLGSDPQFSDFQHAGAHGYQSEWSSLTDSGLALQYLEQRYYDPEVGRFMSPDPIGFAGGLNLYGYVGNDPVHYVDPRGTDRDEAIRNLVSYRSEILAMSKAHGIDPMLLAGVVWVEGYAGGKVPGLHNINNALSIYEFITLGQPASVGIVQYTVNPSQIPGCETDVGRGAWLTKYLSDIKHQLNDAAGRLNWLASRRYGARKGDLSDWEVSIVLTEYNGHPTNTPNSQARPSNHYGSKFLKGAGITRSILHGKY